MYSFCRRFFAAFSAAVSFRLHFAMVDIAPFLFIWFINYGFSYKNRNQVFIRFSPGKNKQETKQSNEAAKTIQKTTLILSPTDF